MNEDKNNPNQPTPPVPAEKPAEERQPYVKPALKNHGNLRLISQMS